MAAVLRKDLLRVSNKINHALTMRLLMCPQF